MEISIKISTLIQLLNNKNKKEDERVWLCSLIY
jgi:hypothetical protein